MHFTIFAADIDAPYNSTDPVDADAIVCVG